MKRIPRGIDSWPRNAYLVAVEITGEMQAATLRLRASGTKATEIAKKVGLSVRSVQRIAKATAYHEAGHAAVGAIFGNHPDWATLIPDPDTNVLAGVTEIDADLESKEGLKEEIINCYAGQCAELRAGGSIRRAKLGGAIDDQIARDCLKRLHGEGLDEKRMEALEKEMRAVADTMVEKHWPLVERIAAELLRHSTLVLEELEILRAIYQGEKTEADLNKLREGLSKVDAQCHALGKTAVYKGSSKEFGPELMSTWSCE